MFGILCDARELQEILDWQRVGGWRGKGQMPLNLKSLRILQDFSRFFGILRIFQDFSRFFRMKFLGILHNSLRFFKIL